MKQVKGEYIDHVTVTVRGEEYRLHVWRNPETGKVFAVDNLEIPINRNSVPDPYQDGVRVVFEDTFTGLPK